MSSYALKAIGSARERSSGYLSSARRKRVDRFDPGGAYEQAGSIGLFGQRSNFSNSRQFYNAFRDTAFTAIRPVATRFAQQPIRVAVSPRRDLMGVTEGTMVKSLRKEGFLGHGFEQRQKHYREGMPRGVKQALPPDSIILDEHIIIEAFRRPNMWHSDYTTLYSVASSMLCCGSAMLTWDEENLTPGISGVPTPSIYYIPMHWVEPKPNILDGWIITPPHTSQSFELGPGEFIYFQLPDPGDPFDSVSPMRAVAKAINTADKIHDANYHGLENLVNPSYAIVAGKLDNPLGGGSARPHLKGEQRRKLTNLIKQYAQGVLRNGDPIILDGIIEDVKPLGTVQKDVDYTGGNAMTERKIMQGFGVSPVVAGYAENANRNGSNTAHEVFYDVVLNPMLVQSGRALTQTLGPKYSTEEYRVTVYLEQAQVNDPDLTTRRVALFRDRLSDKESRRFMRTGELDYEDEDRTFDEERRERESSMGDSAAE